MEKSIIDELSAYEVRYQPGDYVKFRNNGVVGQVEAICNVYPPYIKPIYRVHWFGAVDDSFLLGYLAEVMDPCSEEEVAVAALDALGNIGDKPAYA
jgi:hypothetical protein